MRREDLLTPSAFQTASNEQDVQLAEAKILIKQLQAENEALK